MFKPIKPINYTLTLGAPVDWDEEKDGVCAGLPVYRDDVANAFTSTWMPSKKDRDRIASGHGIDLSVFGSAHPPVALSVSEVVES